MNDMNKEHPGSRDMYDFISKWETCSLVVSTNLKWDRFGILGIMGDYVLRHTIGDIVEIGVGESTIFLTRLAEIHVRKVYHCDICISDITNMQTIDGIFGKDNLIYNDTSDKFFRNINFTPIALGFIDGDHNYEQVKRDFDNLLPLVVDDGFIFLHDTYPPSDDYLSEHRCGNVYKLRQELEQRRDIDCFTFSHGAMDVGFTMIRKLPKEQPSYRKKTGPEVSWL